MLQIDHAIIWLPRNVRFIFDTNSFHNNTRGLFLVRSNEDAIFKLGLFIKMMHSGAEGKLMDDTIHETKHNDQH